LFALEGLTSQGAGKLLVLLNQLNEPDRDPCGVFGLLKTVSRELHADETKLLYELRMALAESKTLLDLAEEKKLDLDLIQQNGSDTSKESEEKLSHLDWEENSQGEVTNSFSRNDMNQLNGENANESKFFKNNV
jgi:hypothetical protein